MRTQINEFSPESRKRGAAEILAGMVGLRIVLGWFEDDEGFHVRFNHPNGEEVTEVFSTSDVVTFSHGALATLHSKGVQV